MNIPLTPLRFRQRALTLYGGKTGVVCGEYRFTYRSFFERCDRLAWALTRLGVERGGRVAFLSPNCHRLLEAYYGVNLMGGVLVPLNIRFSKEDLAYALNDSGASALFFHTDFLPLMRDLRSRVEGLRHYVPLETPTRDAWDSVKTYDDLLVESGTEPFRAVEPDEDEVAEIFYTSGTTANPKGVMLTHRNLYLHALSVIIATSTTDADVQLHTIPLFHVNGWGAPQSLTCAGGTHVMLQRFDPAVVFDLLEREGVTKMSLVPTMAQVLLTRPELGRRRFPRLSMINLGGAAASEALVRRVQEAFPGAHVFSGYGLTETSPVLTLATLKGHLRNAPEAEKLRRAAMTGWPLVGVELRVVRDDGKDVAPDGREIGEIIVRSDGVMKGYWRQPEETAAVLRGGWLHTGDMATIDSEGYVLIVDRKKDIIISGGENISSIEVESAVYLHPDVLECAVFGVPDRHWGEVPKALVVVKEGSKATENDLIAHCRERLAPYKCPHSVEFRDALPKGGTGKVLKRLLKQPYWNPEKA